MQESLTLLEQLRLTVELLKWERAACTEAEHHWAILCERRLAAARESLSLFLRAMNLQPSLF